MPYCFSESNKKFNGPVTINHTKRAVTGHNSLFKGFDHKLSVTPETKEPRVKDILPEFITSTAESGNFCNDSAVLSLSKYCHK